MKFCLYKPNMTEEEKLKFEEDMIKFENEMWDDFEKKYKEVEKKRFDMIREDLIKLGLLERKK